MTDKKTMTQLERWVRRTTCRLLGHRLAQIDTCGTLTMELDPVGAPGEFTTVAELGPLRECSRCGAFVVNL